MEKFSQKKNRNPGKGHSIFINTEGNRVMKEKLSDKALWAIVVGILAGAIILVLCLAAGEGVVSGKALLPTPFVHPTQTPEPTSPGPTGVPAGYRLPLVPIWETPSQTNVPYSTPGSVPEASGAPPVLGVYDDTTRTLAAAGLLAGKPVAVFMIRQREETLSVLGVSQEDFSAEETPAMTMEMLLNKLAKSTGVQLQEYIYVEMEGLEALIRETKAADAYLLQEKAAMEARGEARARAMLLLGAELYRDLKDISPLKGLLLERAMRGLWGSSLNKSQVWKLGGAIKRCKNMELLLIPANMEEDEKNILKNFFSAG